METMEGMGVKKGVEEPRAANIGDDCHLVTRQLQRLKRPVQPMHHPFMGTSRTKERRPPGI
jgi:hypothetical protein